MMAHFNIKNRKSEYIFDIIPLHTRYIQIE